MKLFALERSVEWEGVCIEARVLKTMNEKEEDDPVLHIMEEIRDVAKLKKKKKKCFLQKV